MTVATLRLVRRRAPPAFASDARRSGRGHRGRIAGNPAPGCRGKGRVAANPRPGQFRGHCPDHLCDCARASSIGTPTSRSNQRVHGRGMRARIALPRGVRPPLRLAERTLRRAGRARRVRFRSPGGNFGRHGADRLPAVGPARAGGGIRPRGPCGGSSSSLVRHQDRPRFLHPRAQVAIERPGASTTAGSSPAPAAIHALVAPSLPGRKRASPRHRPGSGPELIAPVVARPRMGMTGNGIRTRNRRSSYGFYFVISAL